MRCASDVRQTSREMNHSYDNLLCTVLVKSFDEEKDEEEVFMSSSEDDVNPTGSLSILFL